MKKTLINFRRKIFDAQTRPSHLCATTVLLLFFFASAHLHASPRLSSLFSDHMVIQRDMPTHIAGTARAGETIQISLANQHLTTRANSEGTWSVTLAPMPAGGPYDLTIHGEGTVIVHDILFGEVWIASGQSNMDFPLQRSDDADKELAQAELPWIRLYNVPKNSAFTPQHEISAKWMLCNATSASEFSAVAYYFAKDLYERLHVPVGIVQATWAGSTGEEWTSDKSLTNDSELKPIVDRWKNLDSGVRRFARAGEDFSLRFDSFELLGDTPSTALNFSDFHQHVATTSEDGFWWTSEPGYESLVHDGSGDALRFFGHMSLKSFPPLSANKPNSKQTGYNWTGRDGIHFRARGPGCFHLHLEEPEILDGNVYASRRICVKDEWENITFHFQDFKQAGWGVPEALDLGHILRLSIDPESKTEHAGERPPSGLYNGMISPLAGTTFRGVLWYQGEGNASRAFQYRTLLLTLIRTWRQLLDTDDLPFLVVQLPNLGKPTLNSEDSGWAELREAQAMTAAQIKNVGLVSTIDLGEALNLHPPHKREVGRRLGLLAAAKVYGQHVEFSGPVFQGARFNGGQAILNFAHAHQLQTSNNDPVKGFAIAGEDRKFHPAIATIIGGKILLSSPDVQHPTAARYGWAGNPICNLINDSRLPAVPFRTDDWREVTMDRR
jgi:sialate O-acetylesterase